MRHLLPVILLLAGAVSVAADGGSSGLVAVQQPEQDADQPAFTLEDLQAAAMSQLQLWAHERGLRCEGCTQKSALPVAARPVPGL